MKKPQVVYGDELVYRDELNSGRDNKKITHSILNLESFDYKVNFMEYGVTHNNLTKNKVKVVFAPEIFKQFVEVFKYTIN